MTQNPPSSNTGFYERAFGSFSAEAIADVRRQTYGEDLGQNDWSSADEFRDFAQWLGLCSDSHLIDICSGSGGPALFLADHSGCRVTGVDIHPDALRTARQLARARELEHRSQFAECDVTRPLPFPDGSFDALICIDSIVHLRERQPLLNEWHRLLKPGGRFVYTDPTLVTGIVSKDEVVERGTPGFFLYTPVGLNERQIAEAGLELERQVDLTASVAELSERWHAARASRRTQLVALEGDEAFERMQRFLTTTRLVSIERRLTRAAFVGYRP